ncbi:hypothetical protein HELRODRAFT_171315 [Helobdella robusta]|uniref:Uncharacterized protein n=1 Tax=Helobdella robusta TaxID=6412 RepID=T1F435_HELRO|nr:hypothetical protein HELRODRAFT_171315 [Helobdella robusta]ESO05657.1 hypothetical protein HELRODRAFT_171315 [Helobdella robusta]
MKIRQVEAFAVFDPLPSQTLKLWIPSNSLVPRQTLFSSIKFLNFGPPSNFGTYVKLWYLRQTFSFVKLWTPSNFGTYVKLWYLRQTLVPTSNFGTYVKLWYLRQTLVPTSNLGLPSNFGFLVKL